jgi:tellurite resistance protein TehA-like permease
VLGAGVTAVAVKLSSAPAYFALVYHAQPLDPNLARALFEMNTFAFFVTWYLQAALLLAVTALSLAHRALPLWLGVPAGVIAISLLVAVQFAVTNLIVVPELLWLVWVVVTSVYLTIWPPRTLPAVQPR